MKPAILAGPVGSTIGAAKSRAVIDKAIAALRSGDQLEAEQTIRRYLLEAPDDPKALTKLAEMAKEDGRMEEAAMLLRRASLVDPSAPTHFALARQLLALSGPAAALAEIESLPPSIRASFELAALEAVLLGMLRRHEEQLRLYDALTAERPRDPVLWINRASALNAVGRVEDAVASLRTAIRIQPSCGEAYWALANLKSWRFADRDIALMRRALRGSLREIERLHFEFALGRALEQRQAFSESFAHYDSGNQIRSRGLQSHQVQLSGFVSEAIATFSEQFLSRQSAGGCKAADPIFVVGLHRSGSTLIEQILATHSMIEGTGELPVLQQIFERIARQAARSDRSPFEEMLRWDRNCFEAIGAEYLERTRPFRLTGRPRFVDKLPANWLNVGLIRLALPNARIIDSRRNPMACGFSNFKQNYAVGVNYAYSLKSIGRFYRDYLKLMQHFDKVQPGAIHHLVNEDLIENFAAEVRRLLGFVGVPFEASCLKFYDNERAVNTPSAPQVRLGINRDGMNAWRAYELWLSPLKEELGPALEAWRPG